MLKVLSIIFILISLQSCTNAGGKSGLANPDPFAEMRAPEINKIIQEERDISAWAKAKKGNSISSYKYYLAEFKSGIYHLEATKRKDFLVEVSKLKFNQVCTLYDSKWIYLSDSCLGNLAHGIGQAKTITGLTFIGVFDKGYRVKGEIYLNNTLMYDGDLKDGKPHGEGVCIYKGEPESCKYYKGKRIDVLFKQRIEFKYQRNELKEQTRILAKQQEVIENKLANIPAFSAQQDNTMGNVLKRKATEKAIDLLFDKLF